jgi:plastocyanin
LQFSKTMSIRLRTIALGFLAFSSAAFGADVTGKITLKGAPPREVPIQMRTDPHCARMHKEQQSTKHFVLGPGGGLGDVFVYIKEGLGDKKYPVPAEPVVLDQVGCFYTPYVFGVQTGQKIVIKNSDPTLHNVHIRTDPKTKNKGSNRVQAPKGPDLSAAFQHPEIFVRFSCDVHPWMFAWAAVVDHPFFAVTSEDGTFKIADVPPGTYVLEAIHRKAGTLTTEVTVGADDQSVDFTMTAPAK